LGTNDPTDEGIYDAIDFTLLGVDEPVDVDLSGSNSGWFSAGKIAEHGDNLGKREVFTGTSDQHKNLEWIFGGQADDDLIGNQADNLINGGLGSDKMYGGDGDDIYAFDPASGSNLEEDLVEELTGTGNDTLDFQTVADQVFSDLSVAGNSAVVASHTGRTVTTSDSSKLENVLGGSGHDTLQGNAASNLLDGGAGDDKITGLAGDDLLVGGAGDDTFYFDDGWGDDLVIEAFDEGTDTLDFALVDVPLELKYGSVIVTDIGTPTNVATHTEDNVENVKLPSGSDNVIVGPNQIDENKWIITGLGEGTLNGIPFSNVAKLVGGENVDTFTFKPDGTISGDVEGGEGDDTFDFEESNQGNGVGGKIKGGLGTDTIIGPLDRDVTWQIDAANAVRSITS
jgi:hypothetical protein